MLDARENLAKLFRKWHRLYELAFPDLSVYNVHVFASHLLHHRRMHGPLHEYAAVRYENSFALVAQMYQSGTPNINHQILRSWYVKEMDEDGHICASDRTLR